MVLELKLPEGAAQQTFMTGLQLIGPPLVRVTVAASEQSTTS